MNVLVDAIELFVGVLYCVLSPLGTSSSRSDYSSINQVTRRSLSIDSFNVPFGTLVGDFNWDKEARERRY